MEGRQAPMPVTSTAVPFSHRGCPFPRKCTSKVSHQKSALAVADIAMGSVESLLGIKWISQYGLLGWRVGDQREMGCVKVKEAGHPPEGRHGTERAGHVERLQEANQITPEPFQHPSFGPSFQPTSTEHCPCYSLHSCWGI